MKVLLVDDDPVTLELLAETLQEQGYAVDTAKDGEDGLYKAETWDYDAIVLDVVMPRVDGWEVLARLRKTKKTPVLMLTGRTEIPDRVRGLDSGADDYLVKPFNLLELLARLRALRTMEEMGRAATRPCQTTVGQTCRFAMTLATFPFRRRRMAFTAWR